MHVLIIQISGLSNERAVRSNKNYVISMNKIKCVVLVVPIQMIVCAAYSILFS